MFDARCEKATREDLATLYEDALPYPPPCIDRNREKTYERCQKGAVRKDSGCLRPSSVLTTTGVS